MVRSAGDPNSPFQSLGKFMRDSTTVSVHASMSASESVSRSGQAHSMGKEENKTRKPINIIDLDDSDTVEDNNEKMDSSLYFSIVLCKRLSRNNESTLIQVTIPQYRAYRFRDDLHEEKVYNISEFQVDASYGKYN
ncbi:predicted protein [Arabidopsis lyrata subsp. lyrata]|uniref:Predicted protein n=1 Tax=Arabidopsis lyrata subsp. lyrata TaxID=81972 RepID=D7MJB0_ARALL|nr:predicted protein [Arabidopsis lyrata subsp. lyrata]